MPEDRARETLAQRWRWRRIRKAVAGPTVWGVPLVLFIAFAALAIATPWIDSALSTIFDPYPSVDGGSISLVDIALKALSPAVNDPTRAAQVIDRLEDLLVVVSRYAVPRHESSLAAGWGRDWKDYVSIATDEIRKFGTTSVQIQRRLRAMFVVLLDLVPEHQHPPLRRRLDDLDSGVTRWWSSPLDRSLAAVADPQGLGGQPLRTATD